MSYEQHELNKLAMPTRSHVENALLRSLFRQGGVVREFSEAATLVADLANEFALTDAQRAATLRTVYRKENRIKIVLLWHRLLFRAADSLAKRGLISRPTQTLKLTARREWMLTEKGLDSAMRLCGIPSEQKLHLPANSYEVQHAANQLIRERKPTDYNPINRQKRRVNTSRQALLRYRAFRQAVIEAYDFCCAACGLKLASPDGCSWEVQAAHVVPSSAFGRDDIWNGIALCRLHHWAFDVGWFTLSDNLSVQLSPRLSEFPPDRGTIGAHEYLRSLVNGPNLIQVPASPDLYPDPRALQWHRQNIFSASHRDLQ